MLNKGKVPWCVWTDILVLLSLMLSTDLIIKKKKIEVCPTSVIIRGGNDDYYVNFKRGMDQAAVEFHKDAGFITLYASDGQDQQMDLVKREIKGGIRMVILAPVKPEETVRELGDINLDCPVILLGQSPDEGRTLDTIGVDGGKIGRLLGETAASQAPRDVSVYPFCRGLDCGDSAQVYEGVRTVLDEWGYRYRLIGRKSQDTYHQVIQETDSPGGGRITTIALSVQSLDQATRILEEGTIYQDRVAEFCGVGSTASLFRALDKGIATGMTTYNQFNEGHLGAEQAVEVIRGTHQKQQIMLEAIYVDEDKLRDRTYEKMLYPIE